LLEILVERVLVHAGSMPVGEHMKMREVLACIHKLTAGAS
jgi:hypothetical protein